MVRLNHSQGHRLVDVGCSARYPREVLLDLRCDCFFGSLQSICAHSTSVWPKCTVARDYTPIAQAELVAGGLSHQRGRQACFFTAVDPMTKITMYPASQCQKHGTEFIAVHN